MLRRKRPLQSFVGYRIPFPFLTLLALLQASEKILYNNSFHQCISNTENARSALDISQTQGNLQASPNHINLPNTLPLFSAPKTPSSCPPHPPSPSSPSLPLTHQLTMPPHLLEIEQKFSFNLANLAPLIRKAGLSPFTKDTSEYNTHAFHDTYYDSHNKLSAAGLWLRKRRHLRYSPTLLSSFSLPSRCPRAGTKEEEVEEEEGKEEWEAKQSVAKDSSFLRSTFSETKDRDQIAELVRAHFPLEHRRRSLGFDNAFGLNAIARFETKRLTLRAAEGDDERFSVVLDVTGFGHEVGEVEVMAEDAEGAHREIEAFCGRYPWFFDMRKPKGKLTAYFERFGYPK